MPKLNGVTILCAILALPVLFAGCPQCGEGGFEAQDFTRVSLNGFDPADNAADKNDYAWAMEEFQADGAERGYVYVATGNNMRGLMMEGMSAMLGGGTLGDVTVYPPEIRRYRGDIFPYAWERVLDYRDVETAPDFTTIGFRYLKAYRAQSDGVNYLYAATFGEEATVWRSATGGYGDWEQVWSSGAIGSVRYMENHNGILYLALANDTPEGEQIAKVYATDGDEFWPVVEDGFGNENNTGAMSLISWNDWLYVGTQNEEQGYEIWKMLGPDEGDEEPVLVVDGGGPSEINLAAITPCVFGDYLYMGNMIHMHMGMMHMKGADIIRIDADDNWETVVGSNSISGYRSGFDHWPNSYIWNMAVHDGWMYASTYDQVSPLVSFVQELPETLSNMLLSMIGGQKRDASYVETLGKAGADLYKTQDGVNWCPVMLDGFGNVGNYGIRTMLSVGDEFYMGTANPFDGLEIWMATSAE